MEFDPQIVVHLAWRSVPIANLPTRVRYFDKGVSHFRLFDDNLRITWAHTRLVVGMLWRLLGGGTRGRAVAR